MGCRGDVDGGEVHRARDGERVLQVDGVCYVDCAGGDVHLSSNGDWIVGTAAAVHGRGDGCRVGNRRGRGGIGVYVVGI